MAEPGERDLRRRRPGFRRHRIEGGQHPEPFLVEITRHAGSAHALAEIRFRSIFAGEEARGETEIGQDAESALEAELLQRTLEPVSRDQIIFGLEHGVARQTLAPRYV